MRIDPELKQVFDSALKTAVGHFNEGDAAIDALVKSAISHQLTPEGCARVTEMFNTARLHNVRATDKLATFDVVESADVAERVFRAPVVAPAKVAMAEIYAEYDEPVSAEQKVADAGTDALDRLLAQGGADPAPSAAFARERKMARLTSDVQLAEDADDRARDVEHATIKHLKSAVADILRPMTPDEQADVCAAVLAHGTVRPELKVALEIVSQGLSPYVAQTASQKAAAVSRAGYFIPGAAEARIISHVDEAAVVLAKAADVRARAAALKSGSHTASMQTETRVPASRLIASWFEEGRALRGELKQGQARPDPSSAGKDAKPAPKPPSKKPEAGGILEAMGSVVPDSVKIVGNVTKNLTDVHKAQQQREYASAGDRLTNFRRGLAVQGLIATDPVLSDAEPERLQSAVEAAAQFAPHLLDNPATLRAWLRQSVQTDAVSPFDAKGLADLEKTHLETTGQMPDKRPNIGG